MNIGISSLARTKYKCKYHVVFASKGGLLHMPVDFYLELMTGLEPATPTLPICPAQKLDFALPTKTL